MKTISSRSEYLDNQIACTVDSLIFGHLQRKQYSKTLHALLSESPHLTKDATTVPNDPNQIILNVNGFLHDQNLEQIIETFYTYGRFEVSPNLLELGKKLRDLTNEFSSELAFGCHSFSNNAQRLYGRKLRTRAQHNPTMVNQTLFDYQLDNNKRVEYSVEQVVPHSLNESTRHNGTGLQYSQDVDSNETRADDSLSHDNAHHSRRKAAQPLKQTQRIMQFVEKMSNDNLRDKEAGVDNSSFELDPFFEADNFNDILKSVVDGDTLYETLESVEREEAMEADQNSRDAMDESGGGLALDIPMHDDPPPPRSSLLSLPVSSHPHPSLHMPPPPPPSSHIESNAMNRQMPRHLMEQHTSHSSMIDSVENRVYNSSAAHFVPQTPPQPSNLHMVETNPKIATSESEKKQSRVTEARDCSLTKDGAPPSQSKIRRPPPPPPPSLPPPSTSTILGTTPNLSSLGRIPKKCQSSGPSVIHPSPSASPKSSNSRPVADHSKGSEGSRVIKGSLAPLSNGNDERKDSMDSQDSLRRDSIGESECAMRENEEKESSVRKESSKSKKASWDDLFDDSPSTVEESNREREKHKESQENKRRELEKKKEREKRRKEKEKKEEDRRDRSRDDRNRFDKRSVDDRRRDSGRDEKEEREKEKEKDDRQRKRREQEEQRKIIEEQKRQIEKDERVRQKKKEEEERKRELKEKEEEKRREKDKEMKKVEDEKMRKEKEIKGKEDRKNELEKRRMRDAQQRKKIEKPLLSLGDSPLDKIAAEMDGKELRNENEFETNARGSSRVMEISNGLERLRSSHILGSLHSSKSGIFLDKAHKLRDSIGRQPLPSEMRRPIRPNRIQMAPMKRPPATIVSDESDDDDEKDEDEEEEEKSPVKKKGKLEEKKIEQILNQLYQ